MNVPLTRRKTALIAGLPFLIGALTLLVSAPVFAGEGLFSRLYTVETTPKGHFELEQLIRNRTGRAFGSYSAFDYSTEFEYGFTDDFQGALYINTLTMNAHGAPDDDDPNGNGDTGNGFSRSGTYMQGVSAEFIYRVMNPVKDPIGLAFYYEPAYDFHDLHNGLRYSKTFENEYKVILQKNFLDDRLIVAYNMDAEVEFIRFDGEESWAGELDWNHLLGATYRFASNWYGGWEFRNHNEIGDFYVHEHSVYWTGPALHYAAPKFWLTLGVLRQFYGVPTGTDPETGLNIGDNHLFNRSHEKWETTLKVGFPF